MSASTQPICIVTSKNYTLYSGKFLLQMLPTHLSSVTLSTLMLKPVDSLSLEKGPLDSTNSPNTMQNVDKVYKVGTSLALSSRVEQED